MSALASWTPHVNPVDIAAFLIVVVNLFVGVHRGLSGELAELIGTLGAFALGWHFLEPFSLWLTANARLGEKPAQAVAFISVALSVMLATILLRLIFGKLMKITFQPTLDKIGGALSGLIRSTALVAVIFVSVNLCRHEYLNLKFGEESVIGRVVLEYIMPRLEKAPPIENLESEADAVVAELGGKIKKR